jgi:hypothetical protein
MQEDPESVSPEERLSLEDLAAQLAADPRPFRELTLEERRARLRKVVGIGRGLLSSSDEFARLKQEEIDLEEERLIRRRSFS